MHTYRCVPPYAPPLYILKSTYICSEDVMRNEGAGETIMQVYVPDIMSVCVFLNHLLKMS